MVEHRPEWSEGINNAMEKNVPGRGSRNCKSSEGGNALDGGNGKEARVAGVE